MATSTCAHPEQEGSRPKKPHIKIATIDLINKIGKIVPRWNFWNHGCLGELSCKGTVPITIKYSNEHYRVMDTEIALSKYGKLVRTPLILRYLGQTFLYVDQGNRPTNVFPYPYVYLKRREEEPTEPAHKPRQLWNERNSLKVSVKDLKNKMKAIPKTIGCENQHLKDIFYDGVKLAVYCSDTREKFTEAKIAFTAYEPMHLTSIILTKRGSLCVIGRDGSTQYLGRDDFLYLQKI